MPTPSSNTPDSPVMSRSSVTSPLTPVQMSQMPTTSSDEITNTKYEDSLKFEREVHKAPVWQVIKNPAYSIYTDADVQASENAGKMSGDIRNRLVRGTIHSMVCAASNPPFNRLPTHSELEEMSKSLVIKYTCLRDSETGHVSISNIIFPI